MKKALITGVAGQDGSYLAELLLADGYEVFGLAQKGTDRGYAPAGVRLLEGDLADFESLRAAVEACVPDEVYNLAGVTDLKTAYAEPEMTWKVNGESVGVLLEASLKANPRVRFLQASSSEIFLPSPLPLNEESPRDWETKNPYAKAKLMADRDIIGAARKEKSAFACSAILFNHESPRRNVKSVIRKITQTLAEIHAGKATSLPIGNVEMSRDWGFAGDYVVAMRDMLRTVVPEDFVVATGKLHTVKEVIDIAAQALGMELIWSGQGLEAKACDASGNQVVTVDPEFFRPNEPFPKTGDSSKVERVLGWKPKVDLRGLVEMMVKDQ